MQFHEEVLVIEFPDTGIHSQEKIAAATITQQQATVTIADKIFISYETVRTHVKHIYKKLHVASASEAVAKAIKERLV